MPITHNHIQNNMQSIYDSVNIAMNGTNSPNEMSEIISNIIVNNHQSQIDNNEPDCLYLTYLWAIERSFNPIILNSIKHIKEIYIKLVELGHKSYKTRYVFNDLDNNAYYIPDNKNKLIVLENQNMKFLIIFEDFSYQKDGYINYTLHIRDLWMSGCNHKYGYKSKNLNKNIDNIKTYKQTNWKPKYRDSRDNGYILSYFYNKFSDLSNSITVNDALYNFYEIKNALMNISMLYDFIVTHNSPSEK